MKAKLALQILLAIGVAGVCFSGYLSYRELLAATPVTSCPAVGTPGTILGYPPCVYGLVMYLAVVAVAVLGLVGIRRAARGPAVHVV
jgi:hypothetical protein